MKNGVSKKLCMTAATILAVTQLSEGAEDKLPYALIIAVICVVYKLIQGFIDWKGENK